MEARTFGELIERGEITTVSLLSTKERKTIQQCRAKLFNEGWFEVKIEGQGIYVKSKSYASELFGMVQVGDITTVQKYSYDANVSRETAKKILTSTWNAVSIGKRVFYFKK